MRSLHLLAAVLPYASAATTTNQPVASLLCSVVGNIISPSAMATATATSALTPAGCQALCKKTSGCNSFALVSGQCRLYKSKVAGLYAAAPSGKYVFWDEFCSIATATPTPTATVTPTAATNNPGTTMTEPTFQEVTSPTPLASSDSPPLPSSDVEFPTDKAWTATYTYEDDPLPTIDAMGTAPNNLGLVAPSPVDKLPCAVDPASGAQFTVLAPGYIPLASKAGGVIGTLAAPTSTAQAKLLGYPGQLKAPQFSFKAASGAASGVYDLVLNGQYVARTSSGLVILTTSSTGPNYVKRNGISMVTSIFSVDCLGRISVSQGGKSYKWATAAGGITTMASGSGSTMFAVTAASSSSTKVKRVRRDPPERKLRPRSLYDEGGAPRCPNPPAGLSSSLKPKPRPSFDNNKCGWLQSTLATVATAAAWQMDDCCEEHLYCYANCESESWEGCNKQFNDCMNINICAVLTASPDPVNWFLGGACFGNAALLSKTASGSTGRDKFVSINKDQCSCFCQDKTKSLCGDTSGNSHCESLFSSDPSNCGACGRTCSAKAACSKGSCVCPRDQCGEKCLDLLTHPDNCGSCGNKCDSGYCWKGQCYNPPADKCNPLDSAFVNGDFNGNADGWTAEDDNSKGAFTISFPSGEGVSLSASVAVPASNFDAISSYAFRQRFPACNDTNYELYFQMKHVSGTSCASLTFAFGSRSQGVNVPAGTSNSFASYGPYKVGPWAYDGSDGLLEMDGHLTQQFRFSAAANGLSGDRKCEVHLKGFEINAVSN